jgi:hypothetical protein
VPVCPECECHLDAFDPTALPVLDPKDHPIVRYALAEIQQLLIALAEAERERDQWRGLHDRATLRLHARAEAAEKERDDLRAGITGPRIADLLWEGPTGDSLGFRTVCDEVGEYLAKKLLEQEAKGDD